MFAFNVSFLKILIPLGKPWVVLLYICFWWFLLGGTLIHGEGPKMPYLTIQSPRNSFIRLSIFEYVCNASPRVKHEEQGL